MRIACIHIPQFALQSATRVDPALRGAAVAVVSGVEPGRELAGVLHAPIVLACSRLAWAHGVRLGMTATAARSQSPEIQIVTADATNERETVRAIADTLLGVSGTVDVGGRVGAGAAHLAMYCEVPVKTRGAAFGERLVELLDELGLAARIGIADDRFTAWVAAAHGGAEDRGVVAVPRGGSAAFLAPRPLSLLAISPEVQHMLEALGVRTLGEFAALPAPSVARPLDADYRALARGESDATLRPYAPEASIREEVTVSAGNVLELQDLLPAGKQAGGLSFAAAIALLARRIELRLVGRGRAAARIDITALAGTGPHEAHPRPKEDSRLHTRLDPLASGASSREVPVTLAAGVADAEQLAHLISAALDSVVAEHTQAHDVWRLRVVVAGEMVLGGATSEIFADGSVRHYVPAIAGEASAPSIYATDASASTSAPTTAVSSEAGESASLFSYAAGLRPPRDRAGAANTNRHSADHPAAESINPLAVVLSSAGSLFALSSSPGPTLRAERRDAHRRTRRGKQRRTRPTPQVQARLFDRTSSKS